jgi:hypothetical protein
MRLLELYTTQLIALTQLTIKKYNETERCCFLGENKEGVVFKVHSLLNMTLKHLSFGFKVRLISLVVA